MSGDAAGQGPGEVNGEDRAQSLQEQLSDYQIGQMLGQGSFGVVLQVHSKTDATAKDRAMKAVPLSLLRDSLQGVDNFKERLKRIEELHHEHIITTYGHRSSKTDLFILMELCCPNYDLFSRIEQAPDGRVGEADAKKVVRNLCKALAYCHEKLIIHGDVKPDNCFYRTQEDPIENVLLSDFSCAFIADAADQQFDEARGSPGYQAPEMLAGKPFGPLVDEWSLGVLVWELLSSASPFEGETDEELRKETLEKDIPYPDEVWGTLSKEALDFTQKLLDKDPATRMPVKDALNHQWLAESKA